MKWLFTMEYVGEEMWRKKEQVAKAYKQHIPNGFVDTESSCGISKADFDIMQDELQRKNIQV